MKSKSRILKTYQFLLSTCILLIGLNTYGQNGIIQHLPSSVEIQVGDTFMVSVAVDPASEPVSVVDLHMIFDPAYLEVVSVTPVLENISGNIVNPVFDNVLGTISMGVFNLGDMLSSNYFEIMEIQFIALAAVEETEVIHPQYMFPKTVMAFAGENILELIEPISIRIFGSPVSTVEHNIDGIGFEIWPNPTSDLCFLKVSTDQHLRGTIEVFDASGKKVVTTFEGDLMPNSDYQFELNVSHLSPGFYICKLSTNRGILAHKLLVQK